MEKTIEMDRVIYTFKDTKEHEVRFWLVKEQTEQDVSWVALRKSWEYSLWYEIGERGGLCEAGELLLSQEGKSITASIEEYVSLYRAQIENAVPVAEIFSRFAIRVEAWRLKDAKSKYMIERFDEEWKLNKVREDADKIYYEKDITTVDELGAIWTNDEDKEYSINMVVAELPAVA